MADSQIAQAAASLDLSSITANLVILAAFISAAVTGVWQGLKRIKESVGKNDAPAGHKVLAASIIEHVTLQAWSESNGEVVKALHQVCEALHSSRDANHALRADIASLRHTIAELRHHIELSDAKRG